MRHCFLTEDVNSLSLGQVNREITPQRLEQKSSCNLCCNQTALNSLQKTQQVCQEHQTLAELMDINQKPIKKGTDCFKGLRIFPLQ